MVFRLDLSGVSSFIMLAGSAMEVTEFDGWMAMEKPEVKVRLVKAVT